MNVFLIMNLCAFLLSLGVCYYFNVNLLPTKPRLWLPIAIILAGAYAISHARLFNGAELLMQLCAWLGNTWLAVIFYALLLMLLHLLLVLAYKLSGHSFPYASRLTSVGLICIILFVSWGIYRAFTPDIRHETIVTEKPLKKDLHVVFVSDLHFGHILDKAYSETLVERINAQKPDLVLFGGDIVDEQLSYIKSNGSLDPLTKIKAPLGVFACFGNHDYLSNQASEFIALLKTKNVQVLHGSSVILPHYGIKLSGLPDYSHDRDTNKLIALAPGNANYYSIMLDHQPRKILPLRDAGYDLMLSGHTHTGQMWPWRYLIKRMYLLDYGRQEFGGLTAIVSNGYGFWGPPVRTGPKPEMVVIDLQQK